MRPTPQPGTEPSASLKVNEVGLSQFRLFQRKFSIQLQRKSLDEEEARIDRELSQINGVLEGVNLGKALSEELREGQPKIDGEAVGGPPVRDRKP